MTQRPYASVLIALLGGVIFPLALAPFFYWPLGVVSLGLLFFVLKDVVHTRRAFGLTWVFAFAQFAVGVSWIYVSIHDHGGTPAWLAVPMVLVFAAFLALIPATIFALRQRLFTTTYSWLTFPTVWVLQEWCRSWLLTGFPWLFAGDAHIDTWLSGWAPITGSYGISFIVAISASALVMFMRERHAFYIMPLLLWPLGALLATHTWTSLQGTISVAVVQGNVNQERKWLGSEMMPTIERYKEDTLPFLNIDPNDQNKVEMNSGVDLVLWPETAITMILNRFRPLVEDFNASAQDAGTTIITGVPFRWQAGTEYDGNYHNSVIAFGAGEGLYHKQRLVPFGEYVPLANVIRGWIPFFDLPVYGFIEGKPDQALLKVPVKNDTGKSDTSKIDTGTNSLALIAPFICYEIAYPDLVRNMAKNADLLVTISNDAWFGNSLGPKQHMAMAQMRALETQRWLLRSTNTGISALVDHRGKIVQRLPVNQRVSMSAIAERRLGMTPYMRWEMTPLFCLMGLILGLTVIRQHYRKS